MKNCKFTKNLLFPLLGIFIFLLACSQQEEVPDDSPVNKTESSANHFYGVKYAGGEIATKGVAQRPNLWYPGTAITVKFLEGSEEYRQKVMDYASQWEEYAGITFQFVTDGNANVRIGFDWNENRWVTWSYIGTDCKILTDQGDATMSFADWDYKTEEEKKGDVLRAFGQVLGLELEHRHLDFDANWTSRIASYWEGEIEDVPWDILRAYVFDPLLASNVIMTEEYDENSIMVWPFTSRYAGNTSRTFNYQLSDMDKQFIAQLYPKEEIDPDIFVFEWEAKANETITFRVNCPEGGVIDWGDGVSEEITYITDYTYTSDGIYQVKVNGLINELFLSGTSVTKVIQWGNIQMDEWGSIFSYCDKLTSIPGGIPGAGDATSFYRTFEYCTGLTSIPENLFENNINIKLFASTFSGCSGLRSIPEKLFEKNTNVIGFESIFNGCSGLINIPDKLFKNNINVTNFAWVFAYCTGLISIPERLFEENVNTTSFKGVFEGCIGLTNIPENLFIYNINANFWATFSYCTGLTNIPENLFIYNLETTTFLSTFEGCTGLTSIPEKLFENNVAADGFSRVFRNCTGLTNIPENLFKNNVNAMFFDGTFADCTGLVNIPTNLFDYNEKVCYFEATFENCTGLTGTTPKTNGIEIWERLQYPQFPLHSSYYFFDRCFRGCTGLVNYNEIPSTAK